MGYFDYIRFIDHKENNESNFSVVAVLNLAVNFNSCIFQLFILSLPKQFLHSEI